MLALETISDYCRKDSPNVFETGRKKWDSDCKESREMGEEAKDESQGTLLLVLGVKGT